MNRRIKIMSVPKGVILDILNGKIKFVLPEGASIESIYEKFLGNKMLVLVKSESFEAIPEGRGFPYMDWTVEVCR